MCLDVYTQCCAAMTSFEKERVKLFHLTSFPTFEECLRSECEALCSSECDNLWIPKEEIGRASSLAIEILIAQIYNSITAPMVSSDFAGVEFWVQVRTTVEDRPPATACTHSALQNCPTCLTSPECRYAEV